MSSSKCIRVPTGPSVAGMEPTDYIPPETLQSGDPQERGRSFYADQTGQLDAGDSFVMPRGCKCTWDVKEPVRKLYVVLTAEAYRD